MKIQFENQIGLMFKSTIPQTRLQCLIFVEIVTQKASKVMTENLKG